MNPLSPSNLPLVPPPTPKPSPSPPLLLSPFSIPYPPELDEPFSLPSCALEDRMSASFRTNHPFYRIPPPDERVWSYVEQTRSLYNIPLQTRFLVHREYVQQGKKWIIHDAITVKTENNSLGGWMRKLVAYESTERSPFTYDIDAMDRTSQYIEQQEAEQISLLWASTVTASIEYDSYHLMKQTLQDSGAFNSSYSSSPIEPFQKSIRRLVKRSSLHA